MPPRSASIPQTQTLRRHDDHAGWCLQRAPAVAVSSASPASNVWRPTPPSPGAKYPMRQRCRLQRGRWQRLLALENAQRNERPAASVRRVRAATCCCCGSSWHFFALPGQCRNSRPVACSRTVPNLRKCGDGDTASAAEIEGDATSARDRRLRPPQAASAGVVSGEILALRLAKSAPSPANCENWHHKTLTEHLFHKVCMAQRKPGRARPSGLVAGLITRRGTRPANSAAQYKARTMSIPAANTVVIPAGSVINHRDDSRNGCRVGCSAHRHASDRLRGCR